jgi:hypothetical protein
MAFSIYEASVPVFQQTLKSLLAILDKAAAHVKEHGIAESELVEARLFPDMLPFKAQIMIATDQAKGASARLSGTELPSYPDEETTIAELQARLAKTIAFVSSIDRAKFEGGEDRAITISTRTNTFEFIGSRYLTYWALPNFFFHATTAYDILRHKGVVLGKPDFLGSPNP